MIDMSCGRLCWPHHLADMDTLDEIVVTTAAVFFFIVMATGCTPTVKVATDEPITINLNVNIKHEILVKVDKELDDLFSDDSDLF